jgi:hypothetical protein
VLCHQCLVETGGGGQYEDEVRRQHVGGGNASAVLDFLDLIATDYDLYKIYLTNTVGFLLLH